MVRRAASEAAPTEPQEASQGLMIPPTKGPFDPIAPPPTCPKCGHIVTACVMCTLSELSPSVDPAAPPPDEAPPWREVLQGLVDAVTAEVNEKGGGGFILARLSDARALLAGPAQPEAPKEPR